MLYPYAEVCSRQRVRSSVSGPRVAHALSSFTRRLSLFSIVVWLLFHCFFFLRGECGEILAGGFFFFEALGSFRDRVMNSRRPADQPAVTAPCIHTQIRRDGTVAFSSSFFLCSCLPCEAHAIRYIFFSSRVHKGNRSGWKGSFLSLFFTQPIWSVAGHLEGSSLAVPRAWRGRRTVHGAVMSASRIARRCDANGGAAATTAARLARARRHAASRADDVYVCPVAGFARVCITHTSRTRFGRQAVGVTVNDFAVAPTREPAGGCSARKRMGIERRVFFFSSGCM